MENTKQSQYNMMTRFHIKPAVLSAVMFVVICCSAPATKAGHCEITIGDAVIRAEIADTPKLHYQGLSHRDHLCGDCGMLFVFSKAEEQRFVMRNMNFSLDIIWINENRIIKIDKMLQPEGQHPSRIYSSGKPVQNVLEVNGGFCDMNKIKTGDAVIISP